MIQRNPSYIGINQRVPFAVLDQGLATFLKEGAVDKNALRAHLLEFTTGVNRANKGAGYAKTILTRPVILLKAIADNLTEAAYNRLSEKERKILVLALVVVTYPIAYNLLILLAKTFKVQPHIATSAINQQMGRMYGSNRTLAIAVEALIPMMIELGAIKRTKVAMYEQNKCVQIGTPLISQAWVYADLEASRTKTIHLDEVQTRPWNLYCKPNVETLTPSSLLKYNNGMVGGGYISLLEQQEPKSKK